MELSLPLIRAYGVRVRVGVWVRVRVRVRARASVTVRVRARMVSGLVPPSFNAYKGSGLGLG